MSTPASARRLVASHKAYLALVLDRAIVQWREVNAPHGPDKKA